MPKQVERIREHSITEQAIAQLQNIADPIARIAVIDGLAMQLDALRGHSVLERVQLENQTTERTEAIPASAIAVMGIMRGRFEDASDAADHLLADH